MAAYELPEANRTVDYDIDGDGDTEETICHACCQSCYESGQIAYVRLIAGSDFDSDGTNGFFDSMSGSVEWTLLFTHRNFPFYFFPIAESPAFESLYPYHPQTAIHSIHVYEGDGGLSGDDLACRTLEFTHFVSEAGEGPPMAGEDTTPLDPLDRVEPSSSGSDRERAIPSGWVREIKYLYTEPQARLNPADETDHAWYDEAYAFASPVPGSGARLIKVTSTITDEDPEQDPSVEYTLYRYDSLGATTASTDRDAMPRRLYQDQTTLREIYRHDKVQDVLRRLNEAEQNPVSWTVNAFAVGALAGSSLFPDPAHALDGDAANVFDFSVGECVEQAHVQEPLRDFASLFLLRWDRERQFDTRWGIGTSKEFELTECEFSSEMVAGYLLSSSQQGFGAVPGLERLALKQVVPGVHLVRGIDGAGDQSTYRIYRFRYRPGFSPQQGSWDGCNFVPWTEYESGTGSGMYLEPFRSIYHEPFRDGPECQHQGYGCDAVDELSRDAVTWITVVDQYPSFEAAQIQSISEGGASSVGWDNNTVIAMPSVRRVIAMNAAGYILNEDVWEFSDDGTSFARTGAREEFIFDDQGRVIEHRTRAWGTEENVASRVTDGLINVFEYPPPDAEGNPRYEVVRRGIKFGTGDENNERDVYPIEERTFHATRPELPLTVTYYPVPEVGEPTESYTTEYDYEFFNDGDQDPEDELIARKTVLGPAMDVGFGSSQAAYRPQETHVYSTAEGERGRLAWRVYGLEPVSGNDGDPYTTRFYDYQHYDGKGRLIRGIVDAEADAPLGNLVDMYLGTDSNGNPLKREQNLGDLTVPAYPDLGAKVGSGRKGPGEHGLHAITKYLHNRHGVAVKETPYGPQLRTEDIEADSIGRQERTYRKREEHETGILEVFRTLTFTEYETPEKQGQVTAKSRDGRVDWTASVTWAWPPPQNGHLPQLEYTKVVDVDLEFDAAGRPTEVEAKGWDGKEIAVKGRTDQYGGFVREIAVDGTITRTYRDPQGRPERVFVGSQDKDLFWGYLGDNTDDLILTQRTAYGHGRTNYGLPKFTRHFRDRPSGQYTQWNWPGEGWGRLYGYDNRLREVWVRDVEPGMAEVLDANDHLIDGPSHRTRVTLYDHLDRVRFSIEYGTAAPDAPDISGNLTIGGQTVNGHTVLPTAAQILGDASSPPLSLAETRYNDAGLVTEQLQYDVSDTTAGSHLSTITHYDGKGRPVLQMSPNAADVVNTYDAKGRIAERMVVRDAQETPFWELERTETEYDAADNAIKVVTRQRLHDAVISAALDDTNSVVTYQWNWFDNQGRLTASADLGSGQPVTDTFTNGTVPEGYDYTDGPSIDEQTLAVSRGSAPDWAIVTCYLYNPVGKKWVQATQTAYDPSASSHDYRVELFQYDSLGNLTFWSENHLAHNDSPDKRMTAYDYEDGKLVRIAAVLPGHSLTYLTVSGPDGQSAGVGYYRPDWLADDGTLQITSVDYQGLDQYVDPLSGEVIWLGARVWTGETDNADNPVWSHNPSWPAAVYFPDKLTGRPDTSGPPDLTFTYYSDGLVRSRKDRLGREFIHHYDRDSQRIRTEILYPDGLYAGNDPEDLANLLLYTYDKRGNLTVASSGEDADGDGALDGPNDAIITQHQYLYNPQGQLLTEYQSYGGPVDTGTTPRIDYAWDYAPADQGNHNRLAQMTYPTRVQSGTRRVIDLIYDGHNGIDDAISRITRIEDDTSTTAAAVEYHYTGASRRVGRQWQSGSPGALTPFMTQSAATNPTLAGYAGLDRHGRVTDLHYRLTDGSQSTVHRYEYGYNSDGSRLFARTTQQGQPNTRSQLHAYDILGRLRETHRGTLSSTNDAIEFSQAVQATQVAWGLDRLGNWTESTDSLHAGRVENRDDDGVPGFETLVLAEEHDTDLRNELTGIDRDEGSGPVAVAHIHDAAGNLVADGQYYIQYDAFNRVSTVYELNDLTFDADGIPISGTPGAWRASYAYDALGRRIHKEVPWAYDSDARWTSYYYDGVRRIAEVHRDPLAQAGIGGNPNPQGSHTTYTDREYVWGPDYVDECLWQVDRPGNTAFVLQDANFNVVGLTDPQGALLQQYDYDPYGTPTAIDTLGAFGHNRLGHQGLFADRYDTDAPAPDLAVDADLMYYARNRDYRPDLGRWVQGDPNGTGQSILSATMYAGRTLAPGHPVFDPQVMYCDGLGRYGFAGAAPTVGVDPAGLFGFMGILMTGLDMAGMAMGAVDDARQAYSMTAAVEDFLDAVAVQQMFDVEWAIDMDADDLWYSRSATTSQAMSSEHGGPAMAALWMDWGTGRAAHGGTWHDAASRAYAEYYRIKYGPQNVRFNQTLVDANGKTVSRMCPDVQVYDSTRGRWIIIEIEDSNRRGPAGNAARHSAMAEALGVPESDVSYKKVGRLDPVPGRVGGMMRTRPWSRRP